MRFMMIIKSNAESEAGKLDEAAFAEMRRYNQDMQKAGVWLSADGLKASSAGFRVRLRPGQKAAAATVTDGPFTEAKELIAGFWLIQVKSKEEAVEWAKRVPGTEGELELRQLYELEDFPVAPEEKKDGWRDQEAQARASQEAAPPARKPGTTRWMLLIKGGKATESGHLPSQRALEEMGALMQEQVTRGALLGGEGLKPTARGARVKQEGSRRTVIDGPFTEAKELVAGYSIFQLASREEAVDIARRWLECHVREVDAPAEIEARPIFELEDFPARQP